MMSSIDNRLLTILKNGQQYSIEELAKNLGEDRRSIILGLKSLESRGYQFWKQDSHFVRLIVGYEKLCISDIKGNLPTKLVGQKIFLYDVVDSTNKKAMELAEKNEPEGTVIIANEQIMGKGRWGRVWWSPKGKGLWFSVIFRPRFSVERGFLFTFMGAVAVARAVESILNLKPSIKWPNDLFFDNRKFCGILAETKTENEMLKCVILGIGVNVNLEESDFPAEYDSEATSLSIICGEKVKRVPLLQKILIELETWYEQLKNGREDSLLTKWQAYNVMLDKRVSVLLPNSLLEGIVKGIDGKGGLVLELPDQSRRVLYAGDVRMLQIR